MSFSAIGRDVLARDLRDEASGQPLLDVVTLLAALDSAFWGQNGCLSARIHWVERGGAGNHTPLDYAARLNGQMRLLATALPRGYWPRQQIRDRFDRYKQLEVTGDVQVLSGYDDEFLVALDGRPWSGAMARAAANDCQGRVLLVRPVDDLAEIPGRYLPAFPARNLQSLSVAIGRPGEGLTPGFLRWAAACARRGVTALRTVGRGAFPQLAYSWDGYLPLDLVGARPAGRFTTIEFERPYEQMQATYRTLLARAGELDGSHS